MNSVGVLEVYTNLVEFKINGKSCFYSWRKDTYSTFFQFSSNTQNSFFPTCVIPSAKISRVSIQNPTPSNGLSEEVLSVLDFEKEERMNDVYNRNMKKNFNDTGVFQCPVPNCNRVYSRRRSLSRHRQECGQLPRFHCSLCPYKSKRRDLLKSHMKHGHKLEHITEDQIIVRKDSPVLVAE